MSAADNQSPHLTRGLAAYGRGAYFEAHEHLEDLWRAETDPAEKRALQGLVLVAVAMHKVFAQRKPSIGARLLRRADDRLRGAEHLGPIDVERLRAALEERWERLERGEAITAPALPSDRARRGARRAARGR